MNRLLLAVLAAAIGLSACSKKEEAAPATAPAAPAAPAAAPMPPAATSAATPNAGKVLQVLQAGGYTYAEVETQGQKVWIAGANIPVKAGDAVQWGDAAVMQNFTSKSLNRTFDQILFVNAWGPVGGATAQMSPHGNQAAPAPGGAPQAAAPAANPHAGMAGAPTAAPGAGASEGQVKSVAAAGGYTYLEVGQGSGSIWIAVPETKVKAGDKVRWNGGMVMQNFNAKSLGRTFDQIVFAEGVAVVK